MNHYYVISHTGKEYGSFDTLEQAQVFAVTLTKPIQGIYLGNRKVA